MFRRSQPSSGALKFRGAAVREVSSVPPMPHVLSFFGISVAYQVCSMMLYNVLNEVYVVPSMPHVLCLVCLLPITAHLIGNRHTKKDNTCGI
jgi:ABC-type methionine transport system permease subunit